MYVHFIKMGEQINELPLDPGDAASLIKARELKVHHEVGKILALSQLQDSKPNIY